MLYKVVETPEVKRDLLEALDYIELVLDSPSGAATLASSYINVLENLKHFTNMYPAAREPRLRRLAYRKAQAESYLVLYRMTERTVYISHLFHQSQDYTKLV